MHRIITFISLSFGAVLHAQVPAAAPARGAAVDSEYVLRTNDVVSVSVFQEPDLACSERIAADGTISVPLAGRVKIAGKTPISAASVIKYALESDYLVSAQVTVSVTDATKQFFTLLGQVASPGAYALPPSGRLGLLQAVGMAGGFTRLASPARITVKRNVSGKEILIKVDGEKLASGKSSQGFEVLPGDVITVKERIF